MATVLRDRRQHFAFGALVSAFLFIGALDVLNPDDLIVRTNAQQRISSLKAHPPMRARLRGSVLSPLQPSLPACRH